MPTDRSRYFDELALAVDASEQQSSLYRPTSFWAQATRDIVSEIHRHGLDGFRRRELLNSFFVPTYGWPSSGIPPSVQEALMACTQGSLRSEQSIAQYLSGYTAAHADFRVLIAADDQTRRPHLHEFSESTVGNPVEHFVFDDRRFSRTSLNYQLGLCLLKKHLGDDVIRTTLEVGGGFGSLGEILMQGSAGDSRYIDIDIPPNSLITQFYLSEVFGTERVATYAQTAEQATLDIPDLPALSALCNWQIEALRGEVDLFVNFISFQEMEPDVVQNYLDHVARLGARWILLRNMREGKQLRSANSPGVTQPIRTQDYLNMLPDFELIERNVVPFGFETVDHFHSELLLLKRCS